MAEEVVVKEMLTKEMIEAGADLMHRLDIAHLDVEASLWLYLSESNIWRLVVAVPGVKRDGSKKIYKKIQSVLSKIPEEQSSIALSNISVVDTDDPLISRLRPKIRTGPGISGGRFLRGTINGHFIEDAYIYID